MGEMDMGECGDWVWNEVGFTDPLPVGVSPARPGRRLRSSATVYVGATSVSLGRRWTLCVRWYIPHLLHNCRQ